MIPGAADTSLIAVARRLAAGEVTAGALLDRCRASIAAHDGGPDGLNAVLALDPAAEEAARRSDADRAAGRPAGPLAGAPVIVKDNIDVVGLPTTSGNCALALAYPRCDATVVSRLRQAGAVVIGKANLSEFSFEIRSRSSLGGDVRNPFNRAVTAGGSSGGTAAAVAAGFAVAGLGTDTGGSIRVPAAYNGLVGLRPTAGRLPLDGVAPLAPSTDTVGPIARTVADVRLLWEVLGGAAVPQVGSAALRVGVLAQAYGPDAEIAAATARAIAALSAGGVAIVDPVTLPKSVIPIDRPHIVDSEFAAAFDRYLQANFPIEPALPTLAAIHTSGAHLPDHSAMLAARLDPAAGDPDRRAAILADHAALREALAALMDRHALSAFIYPTSMAVPASLDNPPGGWAPELAACSGWPAITVPAGRAANGVPIGVELLARADAEPLLFALAAIIERELPERVSPTLG